MELEGDGDLPFVSPSFQRLKPRSSSLGNVSAPPQPQFENITELAVTKVSSPFNPKPSKRRDIPKLLRTSTQNDDMTSSPIFSLESDASLDIFTNTNSDELNKLLQEMSTETKSPTSTAPTSLRISRNTPKSKQRAKRLSLPPSLIPPFVLAPFLKTHSPALCPTSLLLEAFQTT